MTSEQKCKDCPFYGDSSIDSQMMGGEWCAKESHCHKDDDHGCPHCYELETYDNHYECASCRKRKLCLKEFIWSVVSERIGKK